MNLGVLLGFLTIPASAFHIVVLTAGDLRLSVFLFAKCAEMKIIFCWLKQTPKHLLLLPYLLLLLLLLLAKCSRFVFPIGVRLPPNQFCNFFLVLYLWS